jgi:hypothetical protein
MWLRAWVELKVGLRDIELLSDISGRFIAFSLRRAPADAWLDHCLAHQLSLPVARVLLAVATAIGLTMLCGVADRL